MSPTDIQARNRYYAMTAVHIVATAGAVFGLVIAGRSQTWAVSILGGAIVISSLYMMAVVPRAMARHWKTPAPPEA